MLKFLKHLKFERVIAIFLIAMMGVVITLSTVHLGWTIVSDIIEPPVLMFESSKLMDTLGLFLLIIIAIELLDTVRIYLREHKFQVQIVFLVAMMAVARKVIVLDLHELDGLTLVGIGVIVIALCAGYFLIRRGQYSLRSSKPSQKSEG